MCFVKRRLSDEKPFACHVCDEKFIGSSDLNVLHQKDTGETQFEFIV